MMESVAWFIVVSFWAIVACLFVWRLRPLYTVTVSVGNADSGAYYWFHQWIRTYFETGRHIALGNKRRSVDPDADQFGRFMPYGLHLLRIEGRWAWVRHTVSEAGSYGDDRYEQTTLTLLGWDRTLVDHLMAQMEALNTPEKEEIPISVWMEGSWFRCMTKAKRGMRSVAMDPAMKERVVQDITAWRAREEWYTSRGLPYRRSFLLEGEPGTGKTSLAFALATQFECPLYVLNVGSLKNDAELIAAFNSMKRNGLLLIEDIDAAQSARDMEGNESGRKHITLSALLNVIDGLLCPVGLLLVMTTNYPQRLDPALLRPGRVDMRLCLGALTAEQVQHMVEVWLVTATNLVFPRGLTGAEVQQVLLAEPPDVKRVHEVLWAHANAKHREAA